MTSYGTVLLSVLAVHTVAMVSPGPNFLIVTQTAVSRSRREGVFAALGIVAAGVVWPSAALLGVELIFTATPWLYWSIKLFGGAYLIYVGIKSWRQAGCVPADSGDGAAGVSAWRAFRLGFITNVANPKAAIFFGSIFAAVLPPQLPLWMHAAVIAVVLGNALWWYTGLALFFSTPRAQRGYLKAKRTLDYLTGGFFIFVGVRLMLSKE